MKKRITMILGQSAFGWLTRFGQVQFLALIAMLSLVTLPALAAADEETPTDLPGDQPAQPALEPIQPVNETIPGDIVEAEIHRILKSVVETAQSLTKTSFADATDKPDADADADAESTPPEPATQEPARPSELKLKEAEIDSITAQIEQEKVESARRLAELQDQLTEAREQLATITAIDGEGFIRSFLVLGPIRVDQKVSNHDEDSNKEFLDRAYVPLQATPKEGDSATVDETELTWKSVKTSDYFVDLAKVANDQELDPEHAAYLGVAYITSAEEVANVKLAIGSDDDSVWRLNGKEVIRAYNGRGIDKDQDTAEDLTLKKGMNVLTFTVLNGDGPTAAAARFLDDNGNPLKGLKVSLTPPEQQITNIAPEAGNNEE